LRRSTYVPNIIEVDSTVWAILLVGGRTVNVTPIVVLDLRLSHG
jgi:hypothetical protein